MSWENILKNEVSGKWWPILQKYLVEKLEEVMRNHSDFMDELEEAGINTAVIRWESVLRQWFRDEIDIIMKQFTDMGE